MIARLNKRLDEDRDGGFTLIELLIVIVILGILAAIVVFAIGSTRGDSVASACKSSYKQVALSAEAVKTKKGKYPTGTLDSTDSNNPLVADSTDGTATPAPLANGALLKEYPKSEDFNLLYSSTDGKSYTLTVQEKDAAGAWENADSTDALSRVVAACEAID